MTDDNSTPLAGKGLRCCWLTSALALLFAITTALLLYTFLWQGSVLPADDGRRAIMLESGERNLVLAEMRGFLQAVQRINAAIVQQDSNAAASAAKQVGVAAQQGVPATLMGKLPADFKLLGLDTHRLFDQLALDAEQLGDPMQTLEALSTLMNNCVACHAAFRIDAAAP
jgi:cytochrome c556